MKPAVATKDIVSRSIEESVAVKQMLLDDPQYQETVRAVAKAMVDALRAGGKVMFFGNGGSAADAQHLAAELTGRYLKDRPGLAGLALNDNTSSLTAIGNDYSYDWVFARQLQGLGRRGDVAIGITTSGNSKNVLKAMEVARERGIVTVGLTGQSGGQLHAVVDHCICIPSADTPRIQESHIMTGHILCEIVEDEIFGQSDLS